MKEKCFDEIRDMWNMKDIEEELEMMDIEEIGVEKDMSDEEFMSRGELGECERLVERELDGSNVNGWLSMKEIRKIKKEFKERNWFSRSNLERSMIRESIRKGDWMLDESVKRFIKERNLDRLERIRRLEEKGVNMEKVKEKEVKEVFKRIEGWVKYEDLFDRIKRIKVIGDR